MKHRTDRQTAMCFRTGQIRRNPVKTVFQRLHNEKRQGKTRKSVPARWLRC
ncbi:hypothetical protein HMPREF9137_1902 [Prevotella denticola F0289]|nr:hypothetical protein HMPREF9137_1902 [Prevotella denticola F0289]